MTGNPYTVTISAFAWSLIATFTILLIAKFKGATPETMVLSGVAIGSLFHAATMFLEYFASDVEIASIVFWTFGDIGRASWRDLYIIFSVVFISSVYFIFQKIRIQCDRMGG